MRPTRSIIGSAIVLAACSSYGSSDTGTGKGPYDNATGTMTASIDGTPFTANYLTHASLTGGTLSISGESFNGDVTAIREVTMAIGNFLVDSTYTLGPGGDGHGGNALLTIGSNVWSSAAAGGSGSVTIISHNATHVVGTFSFVGIRSGAASNVTGGSFDIPF